MSGRDPIRRRGGNTRSPHPARGSVSTVAGLAFGVFGLLILAAALLVEQPWATTATTPATATPAVVPTGTTPASPIPGVTSPPAPATPAGQTAATPTADTSAQGPHVVTIADSLTFDDQEPNTTSEAKSLQVSNEGDAPQALGDPTITGDNPDAFAVSSECGGSIDAASGCTEDVTFTPPSEGTFSATLNINDDQGNVLASVALSGTGRSSTPNVSLGTDALSFSGPGDSESVSVSNDGGVDVSLVVTLGGSDSDYFSQDSDCSTVAAGDSCTITVTFSPGSADPGTYYGEVDVSTDDGTEIGSIGLTGTVPDTSGGDRAGRAPGPMPRRTPSHCMRAVCLQ